MKFVIDSRVGFAILLDVTNVEIESIYESITEAWVSSFVIPLGCFCNIAKKPPGGDGVGSSSKRSHLFLKLFERER